MTIFYEGATLVPDIVTEAEEERILLRISQAPWMTDLSRRVQHYGFRYNYRGPPTAGTTPPRRFPAGPTVVADRLAAYFDGQRPEQCIVNEYRPGQGIGMHADHASFGPVVVSLSLGDAWTMNFRPRSARPYVRERAGVRRDRAAAPPLGPRPGRTGALGVHARHRPRRQCAPGRDACLRDLPHGVVLISAAASVSAEGKVVGHPAGLGADGEGEVVRSFGGVSGKGTEREPARSSTHRHQPG